jgi:hypothetical protein
MAVYFILGIFIGVLMSCSICYAIGELFSKGKVTPIILVKYDLGRFVPLKGEAIGVDWKKDEVIAFVETKKEIGRFVPIQGDAIGVTWNQDEVYPFVEVVSENGQWKFAK